MSVPVWPITLSGRLLIIGLVGHYPTNYLMRRRLIHIRQLVNRGRLSPKDKFRAYTVLAPVSRRYPEYMGRLSTCYSPVRRFTQDRSPFRARLACVRHAASVQSEPESNSPVVKKPKYINSSFRLAALPDSLFNCQRTLSQKTPALSQAERTF